MPRTRSFSVGMGLLVAVIVIFSTLAACGPATPNAVSSPASLAPTVTVPFELPITIALAGLFDDQMLAILDEQIAVFEVSNPDLRVEVVRAPRTAEDRREAFARQLKEGDSSVDIYLLSTTWLAEFSDEGWLIPLDDFAESQGVEIGDFLPSSIEATTLGGQLMALPWTADGGLLYYRRDLLDRYGYELPSTWDDLTRIALDVKDRESLLYGFVWQGAAYEGLTCNTLESVWAYGGDVLDQSGGIVFDSPETHAALRQMVDRLASGASPVEVTIAQEAATLAAFQSGDALFMRNWAYAWDRVNGNNSVVADKVGIAPLPGACLGGGSFALSAHSQHPEPAFRFMAFLVGYEQQAQIALEGVQPPALGTVYQDRTLLEADPILESLYTALLVTKPRPQSAEYAKLSKAIYLEVHSMLVGQQEPEAAAHAVQQRIEAILHQRPD